MSATSRRYRRRAVRLLSYAEEYVCTVNVCNRSGSPGFGDESEPDSKADRI